jgi:hypothetical protein
MLFYYKFQKIHRYFGAAKDLPGVKELFEQEGWATFFSVNSNLVT